MKKLSIALMIVVFAFAGSLFDANAIGISIKFEFGRHNTEGNCGPGRGICSVTIGGSLSVAPGETGVDVVKGDAVLEKDVLTIKLASPVSDKGINEKGLYVFVVDKPTALDKATARQLGVMHLMIMPGKYLIENNVIVLKVKSMAKAADVKRDAASGLPTGKR